MAEQTIAGPAGIPMRQRIAALDVVRGVAIVGTFGTNVWFFAETGGAAAFNIAALDAGGLAERVLRAIPNGKFLALLTLLFGVGLELQYRAARRRGLRWPGRYLRRAGILLVEGFLHYLLVFEYDVLMAYAVTSMIVAYLIGRAEPVLRRWIVGVGAFYLLLIAAGTAAFVLEPVPPPTGPPLATSSWPDQVVARLIAFPAFRAEAIFIVPSGVVLFLVGALLLRRGVFGDGAEAVALRARLMGYGFGIGVPLHVATTWAGSAWFLVERYVGGPLIALGMLALIIHVVLRMRRPGLVRRCLAGIGRTALSCYVLQNLVACVLCYDWGFGLNTKLAAIGPLWPVSLWCGVFVINVVFAALWLRRHDRGPMELLAHRLA